MKSFFSFSHSIAKMLLGRGSSGYVYRADEQRVIKIMSSVNNKEVIIASVVRNIAHYADYFIPISGLSQEATLPLNHQLRQAEDLRAYSLPYGGITLAQYYRASTISLPLMWQWVKHLLMALRVLHTADIVHYDIKENNILVQDEKIRIIDFGLSWLKRAGVGLTAYCSRHPLFVSVLELRIGGGSIDSLYEDYEADCLQYIPSYIRGTEDDIILNLYERSAEPSYLLEEIAPHQDKIDLYMLFKSLSKFIPNHSREHILYKALSRMCVFNTLPDHELQWTMKRNMQYIAMVEQEQETLSK